MVVLEDVRDELPHATFPGHGHQPLEQQRAGTASLEAVHHGDGQLRGVGVMRGSHVASDGDETLVRERIEGIPDRLEQIWAESASSGRDPAAVADAMAQRLIGRG